MFRGDCRLGSYPDPRAGDAAGIEHPFVLDQSVDIVPTFLDCEEGSGCGLGITVGHFADLDPSRELEAGRDAALREIDFDPVFEAGEFEGGAGGGLHPEEVLVARRGVPGDFGFESCIRLDGLRGERLVEAEQQECRGLARGRLPSVALMHPASGGSKHAASVGQQGVGLDEEIARRFRVEDELRTLGDLVSCRLPDDPGLREIDGGLDLQSHRGSGLRVFRHSLDCRVDRFPRLVGAHGHEQGRGGHAPGLVEVHELDHGVERVAPPVVKRVGVLAAVGRPGELAQFALVLVDPHETALQRPERDARHGKFAPVVLRVLVGDVALLERADACHARHVDRVRAGLEAEVGGYRAEVFRLRSERVAGREVEAAVACEEPSGVHERLGLPGKAQAVGALIRPAHLVLRAGDELGFAFLQICRVEFFRRQQPVARAEDVAAEGVPVGLGEPPPAPALHVAALRIEVRHQLLLDLRVAGRQEHLHRRPRQLVVVHEEVPVVGDLLVGAIAAVFRDRVLQEFPPLLRGFEIFRGFLRIRFLECRRGPRLRQSRDSRRRAGRVFRIDDLAVRVFRSHVVLVFPLLRINQEKEPSVIVLHLHEEVRLPFRELDHVADAVAAFGDSEVVERGHAREGIGREDERVDEARRVDRVFAVVARVVVPAAYVHLTRLHERVEAVGDRLHDRCRVPRVFRRVRAGASDGLVVLVLRRHHPCRRHMRGALRVPRVGKQCARRPVALSVDPQRIGARHESGAGGIDVERERGPEPRDAKHVMPGLRERRKIGAQHVLVSGIAEACVRARHQLALKGFLSGRKIHKLELPPGDLQLAQAPEIKPRIPHFRPLRRVGVLVHMQCRTVSPRGGFYCPCLAGKKHALALACHFHLRAFRHRRCELEVKPVSDTQVADFQRGIKDAALESYLGHRHGFAIDKDLEICRPGTLLVIRKIPHRRRQFLLHFLIHAGQLQPLWRQHANPVVAVLRHPQRAHFRGLRGFGPGILRCGGGWVAARCGQAEQQGEAGEWSHEPQVYPKNIWTSRRRSLLRGDCWALRAAWAAGAANLSGIVYDMAHKDAVCHAGEAHASARA